RKSTAAAAHTCHLAQAGIHRSHLGATPPNSESVLIPAVATALRSTPARGGHRAAPPSQHHKIWAMPSPCSHCHNEHTLLQPSNISAQYHAAAPPCPTPTCATSLSVTHRRHPRFTSQASPRAIKTRNAPSPPSLAPARALPAMARG
uniref:Uncharacterized protein n=1 Tax=Triticum urartu TaxID=4572 RepID=A0A8R7U704_TRIUA